MSRRPAFHLFQRFGVELEYMVVHAESLAVLPVTDRVLWAVAGQYLSEIELGTISWSNELALHVIELKTTEPAASLDGLAAEFQEHVGRINRILEPLGGRLMPTAMHPWMDPHREMRLWPHESSPIYEAFHRVFDCRGHGWANLQSVHLNLPFADDDEFARLHAAIRLLLPIMPALAASSPVMDGQTTGRLDNRLEVYRHNARRVPRVSGAVIPEPVFSQQAYQDQILQPLYRDIAPLDPDGTLQFEWLNARGAIARFDRNTIEIRVLDVQECPRADLAVCALLTATGVPDRVAAGDFPGRDRRRGKHADPRPRLLCGLRIRTTLQLQSHSRAVVAASVRPTACGSSLPAGPGCLAANDARQGHAGDPHRAKPGRPSAGGDVPMLPRLVRLPERKPHVRP